MFGLEKKILESAVGADAAAGGFATDEKKPEYSEADRERDLDSIQVHDKWENDLYAIRIISLEGLVTITFLSESTEKGMAGETMSFGSQEGLREYLQNEGFILKSRRDNQQESGDEEILSKIEQLKRHVLSQIEQNRQWINQLPEKEKTQFESSINAIEIRFLYGAGNERETALEELIVLFTELEQELKEIDTQVKKTIEETAKKPDQEWPLLTPDEEEYFKRVLLEALKKENENSDVSERFLDQSFSLVNSKSDLRQYFSNLYKHQFSSPKDAVSALRKLRSAYHPDKNHASESHEISTLLNRMSTYLVEILQSESAKDAAEKKRQEDEKRKKEIVGAAKNFKELYGILRLFGHIPTSQNPEGEPAEEWVKSIEGFRQFYKKTLQETTGTERDDLLEHWKTLSGLDFSTAPRAYGIREKVDNLIIEELTQWLAQEKESKKPDPDRWKKELNLKEGQRYSFSKGGEKKTYVVRNGELVPDDEKGQQTARKQGRRRKRTRGDHAPQRPLSKTQYMKLIKDGWVFQFETQSEPDPVNEPATDADTPEAQGSAEGSSSDPQEDSKQEANVSSTQFPPYEVAEAEEEAYLKEQSETGNNTNEKEADQDGHQSDKEKHESVPANSAVETDKARQESLDQKIAELKQEVEDLRVKYVQEDYDNTNAWARVKKFFGKTLKLKSEQDWQEQNPDAAYWMGHYENKILELQNIQLEALKNSGLTGKELKDGMVELLRYSKFDEAECLFDARTQYKAKNRNWPTTVLDTFGALGRWYNRRSLKEKMMLVGALTTGALLASVSAGAAAGVMYGVLIGGKRLLAGSGAFVATEAMLEKIGKGQRKKRAESEINREMAREIDLDELNHLLKRDVLNLKQRLKKEKRAKFFRKTGAVLTGVAVGSASSLFGEYVDSSEASSGVAEQAVAETAAEESKSVLPESLESSVTSANPPAAPPELSQPVESAPIIEETGATGNFKDLLDGTYEVQKGDSIWKILSSRVEGLEGAQKTHFIDTLKDKIGDVRLQAGQEFDFSQYLTAEDIEKAYLEAQELSAEKMASIAANDVKITEYVKAHPDVQLTHETADKVLQGKMDPAESMAPIDLAARAMTEQSVSLESSAPIETAPLEPVLAASPEMFAQYQDRVDDWFMQIFRVEHADFGQDWVLDKTKIGNTKVLDMVRDARMYQGGALSGYRTGFNAEQIGNFAEFFQAAKGTTRGAVIGMIKENPGITVKQLLQQIAPYAEQGQKIGLYTTTH